jgi:hypothetical protein
LPDLTQATTAIDHLATAYQAPIDEAEDFLQLAVVKFENFVGEVLVNTKCAFFIDNVGGLSPSFDEWKAFVQKAFDVLLGNDPHDLIDALSIQLVDPTDETNILLAAGMTMSNLD